MNTPSSTNYISKAKRMRLMIRSVLVAGYAFLAYIIYFAGAMVARTLRSGEDPTGATLGMFILLFIALFVVAIILALISKNHDTHFKKNVVKPTVENAVPGMTYSHHAPQLTERDLEERQIIPGTNPGLVSSKYRGQTLSYSSPGLSYTAYYITISRERTDKKARLEQPSVIAFQGWVVVATPPKEIDGTVIIVPAATLSAREVAPNLPKIRLEHTKLSEHYNIFSDDEILARTVLTPTEIMALIQTHNDYPRLRFAYHKNLFTIGLPEKGDPFKVGVWQAVNYEQERARIEATAKKLHNDTVAILTELTN